MFAVLMSDYGTGNQSNFKLSLCQSFTIMRQFVASWQRKNNKKIKAWLKHSE